MDVFSTDPGVDTGRIKPRTIVPADGSYVFCLGHDEPLFTGFVQPGSYDELTQTDTLPSGNVFTFQAVTRPPEVPPPPGYFWQASVEIDGVPVGTRILENNETCDVPPEATSWEWYVDLTGLTGSHQVAFRLTYVGLPLPVPPPEVRLPVIEVEIPAFYVDNLSFSTKTGPFLTNEVPTAGQGQSSSVGPSPDDTTNIDFDVFGLGSNVDPLLIQVSINGAAAIVNGIVQPGFHGTIGPAGEILHVTVAPNLAFSSSSIVTVTASATTVSSTTTTRTWTFAVKDTIPPVMTTILAVGTKQLRVTWSKSVLLDNPEDPHDGLNPSLYYVTAIQPDTVTPAVSGGPAGPTIYTPAPFVVVESVAIVSMSGPCVIDLFTNVELTPGMTYAVTELGVEDLICNYVTSVTVTTGFVPPQPPGRDWNLYRMMALMNRQEDNSASGTQDLLRFLNCLQEPTDLLLYDIDTWTTIFDIDTAPDAFLSAMLVDLGNPFPFTLSTEEKRKLLHLLVDIYEQKGTAIGIINTIRFFLGLTVTIGTYSNAGDWILGESILGEDPISPLGFFAQVINKTGATVTLDGFVDLTTELVGRTITFPPGADGPANAGNVGSFVIASVPNPNTITIVNAAGVSPDVGATPGVIQWSIVPDPTAAGTAVLGPGGSKALYSFSIDSAIPLTAGQEQQIEIIANYMKPCWTHLLGIVTPVSPVPYDPWVLGISEMGVDTILHD